MGKQLKGGCEGDDGVVQRACRWREVMLQKLCYNGDNGRVRSATRKSFRNDTNESVAQILVKENEKRKEAVIHGLA